MYFRLTEALKRRFILELRRYWSYHPRYPDLPEHIQGKYSFKERPQAGIIVKTSGGTRVDLSADNFIGTVESYVYLTKIKGYDGLAIEWVREDSVAIQNNGGRFPSLPGVYFIEIVKGEPDPKTQQDTYTFFVDPLLDVYHEQVAMVAPTTGQLQRSYVPGTLRLYEMPSGFMLQEGINYIADPALGTINLASPLTGQRYLSADYRYPGVSVGPFPLQDTFADTKAIPGCVLAFGRRIKDKDRMAVVVQDIRRPAALEYGGRWDITLDVDVMARDEYAQQEIADSTCIYIWGILRSYLSDEGIEITDLSMGGESEEVYDENADDYFYNASFSMTVQTDWSVHVPLSLFIRQAAPLTLEQARYIASLGDNVAGQQGDIQMLESLGLQAVADPFFSGRSETYELIR